MTDAIDLDELEKALKAATSGRWAMFHHGNGVYSLMPAMRPGEIATGLTEPNALLIHLFKWHATALIAAARENAALRAILNRAIGVEMADKALEEYRRADTPSPPDTPARGRTQD